MKKKVKIILGVMVLSMIFIGNSCGGSGTKTETESHQHTDQILYTCPMHPEVVDNEPGNCPKCGMTLVEMQDVMEMEESHLEDEHNPETHETHEQHAH